MISLAIIFYASIQFINLIEYGDNTIMVSSRDSHFGSDFEFMTKNGLQIAFGLTAYDGNQEPIEDPEYGELKAFYKTWGMPGDPPGVIWEELPTKQCTMA